jgi:hypothetical protein
MEERSVAAAAAPSGGRKLKFASEMRLCLLLLCGIVSRGVRGSEGVVTVGCETGMR